MQFSTARLFMLGVLGLLLVLFPADGLRALGLGEARVDSYMGQPLDVTIRLIEADSAVLDSLTATMASSHDHERLGVPAEALAYGLEVSIDRRADPPLLRVRSRRSVDDPVVQFLIDARWSSGRVLREYTLFLDPPTVDAAPPVRPRAVEEAGPAAAPEAQAAPRPATRPAPALEPASAPERRPISGDVVNVAAGQTLWAIADAWRPDTSLTMNQVMLAIFERNQQAFIGGNVNRLRRGAELQMPDMEEVRGISRAEAEQRIRSQMQAWRQEVARTDVPVISEAAVPDFEPERRAPRQPSEPEVVHRLEVVPPESDIFDDGPVVSEGEMNRASARLADLEDQMYAEALDSNELRRQVAAIREAIATREAAGLAVADEEMAILEARLREARQAREETERLAAEVEDDDVSAYFRQLEDELAGLDPREEDAVPADLDDVVDETPVADTVVETGQPAQPQSEPIVPERTAMPVAAVDDGRSLPLWIWLVAGVLLIAILLAAGMVWSRRHAGAETSDSAVSPIGRARTRVKATPSNLAAHLALLEALGAADENDAFADALDQMYQHVDDEDDAPWQKALNLAVIHAPNHPMLTPNETPMAEDVDDDRLDERTREMLGILGAAEDGDDQESTSPDDYDLDSDLDIGDDDQTRLMGGRDDEPEIEGVDLDLAELSNRLDDTTGPDDEPGEEDDDDEIIFDLDDDDLAAPESAAPAATGDDSARQDDEREDNAGLTFDFTDRSGAETRQAGSENEPAEPAVDEDDDEFELELALGDMGDERVEDDTGLELPAEPQPDQFGDGSADRELEAFLGQDTDTGSDTLIMGADESPDQADGSDAGEPEVSDEDAEVKIDLARAYISMDDPDSARTLLEEITGGGSAAMRARARKLIDEL